MITLLVDATPHNITHGYKDNKTLVQAYRLHDPQYTYVLEFGVYNGETLMLLHRLFSAPQYVLYGFDSFEGLPEDWVATGLKAGAFSTEKRVPAIDGAVMIPGWFSDTILYFKLMVSSFSGIALLHIDSDLYSSCKDILYSLNDYIKPGTIIVFDEWLYRLEGESPSSPNGRDGEQKCFFEWAKDFKREYNLIPPIDEDVERERQIVRILK